MRSTLLALLVLLGVIAPLAVTSSAEAAAPVRARVIRWIDGDTVVTGRGTVRLIGVDTPERGRCGAGSATRRARSLAPAGTQITLTDPTSVRDHDRYGRLLRYVANRSSIDVSAAQIRRGAKARYDSRDGYQWHPRQSRFRGLDARHADYRCRVAAQPGQSGPVRPQGWNCPSYAPIKGNRSSMIFHRPGQQYYAATNPEQCFRTAAAAIAAGYRAAKV